MSSLPKRDPQKDHLLTPENSAFIVIDYQPVMVQSVNSMSRHELVRNISSITKMAKGFKVPVVLATINSKPGNETIKPLKEILKDEVSYDRTSINAWEDKEFQEGVKAVGRKKLIINGLWTEACLSFPVLDALHEGYEVYVVADAVGGTSELAHNTALNRMQQAGAKLTSVSQLACEWQRDWNRKETIPVFTQPLIDNGSFVMSNL